MFVVPGVIGQPSRKRTFSSILLDDLSRAFRTGRGPPQEKRQWDANSTEKSQVAEDIDVSPKLRLRVQAVARQ